MSVSDHKMSLQDLGLGTDPVVDMHVLTRVLRCWYADELSSSYSYDKTRDSLLEISAIATAMESALGDAVRSLSKETYRDAYEKARAAAEVTYTEHVICEKGED